MPTTTAQRTRHVPLHDLIPSPPTPKKYTCPITGKIIKPINHTSQHCPRQGYVVFDPGRVGLLEPTGVYFKSSLGRLACKCLWDGGLASSPVHVPLCFLQHGTGV
mmetsp:Transcript_14808/g.24101  ORF Transcript_14808/g.24101 Transcript_14808/m.24101 type:complete len:105 (-) Transcript_14808:1952-2266(-)